MLLSIDPGLNNCGLAVSVPGEQFKVLETLNIKNARKFDADEKAVEAHFDTRVVKLLHIEKVIREVLSRHPGVCEIAIEAPFYHAATPMAFSSLLEVISVIKYKVLYPMGIKPRMVEPLLVKKTFITEKLTKGMNGKEFMKQFLKRRIESGDILFTGDFDALTEHEIDAIAVGFTSKLLEKRSQE